MKPTPQVSVVIPCYNPTAWLEEALAGVRAQTHPNVEIILVNDGTDDPAGLERLRSAAERVGQYLEQPNRGLGAARNTGFRAASSAYVLPLDADDRIAPTSIAECVAVLETDPEAAFVYPDYRVFGDTRYIERTPEYNLHYLLERNTLIYASLIRRQDWELAGGYDESMRLGYEDWEFWLRLAERGRFGRHLGSVLFEYRKHGRSLLTTAREHHDQIVAHLRSRHPGMYSPEGRARIKTRWAPAVCVVGAEPAVEQTIQDWSQAPARAGAFLLSQAGAPSDPQSAELAALAVWGGHASLRLPDGSVACSRRAFEQGRRPAAPRPPPRALERISRHLVNAELSWRRPGQSAGRLIPLRLQEWINRAAGRPVFDLSFYLRFQPQSVLAGETVIEPLRYLPRPAPGRRRIALLTPHLGPGGAEAVLLEAATAIDRARSEVFLIATQSQDDRWRARWTAAADHVYDLAAVVKPQRWIAALYSMAVNWEFDALVVQNSLAGYSALPHLRRALPGIKTADWIHAVDPAWDFAGASAPVESSLDLRVVISQAGRQRLVGAGVAAEKIRLMPNGIDCQRFRPAPPRPEAAVRNILFAGRLDAVKRPLLLIEIARQLERLRPARDFRFLVAGDGPQQDALRRRSGDAFRLLGHVEDVASLLADAEVVIIPSAAEGVPLIALEAMACARPVVCARAGASAEAVDAETGVLIEPGAGEAARFARALHSLLEDHERRAAMGLAGRRRVEERFNLERARQAYRGLFAELCG